MLDIKRYKFLLLPLALQPTAGFGLSKNALPFFPICYQLSPSSHSQHLKISFYFLFPSFPGSSLLLVPSSSWVKIFLAILSSSILSRWPNQLILCPFIHFTIFPPLLICSSSRFVRFFHSPFSYLGPYIRERRSVTLKCAGRPINKWWEIVWICCLEITDTVRLMYFFF